MKLFTDDQYAKLLDNGAPENCDQDHPPVVMLVLPDMSFTWLLSEIDPNERDIAFGLCDLGMGFPELGYVNLRELKSVITPKGYAVQRVPFFEGKYPMSVYTDAAREIYEITTDDAALAKHNAIRLSRINPK